METFLIYLLKSSGILLLFLFTYSFFLKKDTFYKSNRVFLVVGVVASVLLPLLSFTEIVYLPINQEQNFTWTKIQTEEDSSFFTTALLYKTILFFYVIGVCYLLSRLITQILSLYRLIKKSKVTKENSTFTIVETTENCSPFSFFNYIVYNPRLHSYSETQLILEHEKAHCRQMHSLDIVLTHLLCSLLWINPLVWLYKSFIQQNLEFLADDAAVQHTNSLKDYQYTMVHLTGNPGFSSISNHFFNSLIKKRIVMLNKSKSNKYNGLKTALILPLLALFLYSFNRNVVTQYQEDKKEMSKTIMSQDKSLIEVTIDKNTTDEALKGLVYLFKKEDIEFDYTTAKNKSNELIALSLQIKNDKNSSNVLYDVSSDAPIQPVRIVVDTDKNISVLGGSGGQKTLTINQVKSSTTVSTNNNSEEKSSTSLKIRNSHGKEPLYIVNGKSQSEKDIQQLDPNTIESMNVFKDETAIKKYGKKGKNGVIEITLKKEK